MIRYLPVKAGSVQTKTPQVAGSNIYSEMVTRNMTTQTYTTSTDGTAIALNPPARGTTGDIIRQGTPNFSGRYPKGMLLRSTQGPVMVNVNPYSGYNVTRS